MTQSNLKFILPILVILGGSGTLSHAKPPKPKVQMVNLPAHVRFFSDLECAKFVLDNAKVPASAQAPDLAGMIAQIEQLPYHQTTAALLNILERFIDDSHSTADNQPQKGILVVPWMGHLERIIFVIKHTKLPIDPAATSAVLNFAEKYRGVVHTQIVTPPEDRQPPSEFYRDLAALQTQLPKFIEAALNLVPECDSVCNQTAINNVQTILARNRNCSNIVSLLHELERDLPNVIQSPDLLAQLTRIKNLIGPMNHKGHLVRETALKLRVSSLVSNNRLFVEANGVRCAD